MQQKLPCKKIFSCVLQLSCKNLQDFAAFYFIADVHTAAMKQNKAFLIFIAHASTA